MVECSTVFFMCKWIADVYSLHHLCKYCDIIRLSKWEVCRLISVSRTEFYKEQPAHVPVPSLRTLYFPVT